MKSQMITQTIALIGGEEFADGFEEGHARLAEIAYNQREIKNSHPLRLVFLPTCAAHDGLETVNYWCDLARQRLGALGAEVSALHVIDRESAEDPAHAHQIAEADWIYLGGGYPHVGLGILRGTRALEALDKARQRGALISGASGGAMLLCEKSWVITPEFDQAVTDIFDQGRNPEEVDLPPPPFLDCLGWIPGALCWPHLNQFFAMHWVNNGMVPQGCTVIGIDEQTAVVYTQQQGWDVMGKGRAVIIDPQKQLYTFTPGEHFSLQGNGIPGQIEA